MYFDNVLVLFLTLGLDSQSIMRYLESSMKDGGREGFIFHIKDKIYKISLCPSIIHLFPLTRIRQTRQQMINLYKTLAGTGVKPPVRAVTSIILV